MASPQVEDGHVDIANELAEQFAKTHFSSYETRVLWTILRKTYGWHKKSDHISYSQFEKATGLGRRHIARTLNRLKERAIITIRGNKTKLEYGLQKDYTKWIYFSDRHDALPIGVTIEAKSSSIVTKRGNERDNEPNRYQTGAKKRYQTGDVPLPNGVTKSLPIGVTTKEKKETIQKKEGKRVFINNDKRAWEVVNP